MRRESRIVALSSGALLAAFSVGFVSTARGGLLYQWNFDQNGGTGSTVSPAVTPNSLATDGGVLTMAQFGGFAYTPTNLYTASGGGVSGAAGDYAFDNSASASNNSNPGGITYSSGAADPNNANTVNALPNLTSYTMTMWVKPTTAELNQQSRLMQIGTTSTFDESTNGLWVGLNTGKVQTGGGSANTNSGAIGNTLVVSGADKKQALLDGAKAQQQSLTNEFSTGFTLQSANALWGDKSFTFDPVFISNIQASFGGSLTPVNFKHPVRTAVKINDWVSGQTQGKIQNLVSPEMLQSDPAMVLTNAVYFKARWRVEFNPTATKPAPFHVSPGHDVTAEMMNDELDKFSFHQVNGAKILGMDYGDAGTAMVIILPDAAQGLAGMEAQLSAAKLNDWLTNMSYVPVILSVPKFQSGSTFALNGALQFLGMKQAFDQRQADFTGIADDPSRPLYIGAVVHKANIEVDEQGTEAAAATVVSLPAAGGIEPPPPPPVRFNADHPFIYLIYSYETNEILFMGRVDDPTQQGN